MQNIDEMDLIIKAQNGDKDAENILSTTYLGLVKTIANTFASIPYRDDLISDGLLALIKAIRTYDVKKQVALFKTYASTCIKNAMKDRISINKKFESTISTEDIPGGIQEPKSDIETNYITEHELRGIMKTISSTLNDKEKPVYKLYIEGLSYQEIAEQLNISKKTVDNRIQSSKKKIESIIKVRNKAD